MPRYGLAAKMSATVYSSIHSLARRATASLALVLPFSPLAHGQEAAGRVLHLDVLRNGSFSEPAGEGIGLPPWWRVPRGATAGRVQELEDGTRALRTETREEAASALEQPLFGFAPLTAEGFRLSGEVRGRGRIVVAGAGGALHEFPFDEAEFAPFELTGADVEAALGEPLVPRLTVSFAAANETGAVAEWRALRATAPFPSPSEEELRAEVLELVTFCFDEILASSLDDEGPESTALWCRLYDADSGAPLPTFRSVHGDPVHTELLRAWQVEPLPRWEAQLTAWMDDWLRCCLHDETGLPRGWDPVADRPLDREFVEVAWSLRLLLDWAEGGPEAQRERCLAAARRIGEAVLARGVRPDHHVAAKYRPSDGAASMAVPEIRYLDVPAQLARLGAATGDERYVAAARNAALALEYTHAWPGDWRGIDPGFDDTYGHLGARSIAMWKAVPGDAVLRRFALGGFLHYAPIWRDALRHGGNVAADQVRCWKILRDIAHLDPAHAELVRELLLAAAHSHARGEQGENGVWTDVTIGNFDPKSNLGVGDIPGLPVNLIEGLAAIYDGELELDTEELRALYTGVLRSSVAEYGHEHGFRSARRAGAGEGAVNAADGTIRLLAGLVEMLRALS